LKRIFIGCLVAVFILISALPGSAAEGSSINNDQQAEIPASIEQVIYQEVEAEHNQNWSTI